MRTLAERYCKPHELAETIKKKQNYSVAKNLLMGVEVGGSEQGNVMPSH